MIANFNFALFGIFALITNLLQMAFYIFGIYFFVLAIKYLKSKQ